MDQHASKGRLKLHTLIHGLTDAALVTDLSGQIVDINPAGERLFGRGLDELAGEPVSMLVAEFRGDGRCGHAASVLLPGQRLELVGRSRNGIAIPLIATCCDMEFDGETRRVTVLRDRDEGVHGPMPAKQLERILDMSWNEIYVFDADSLRFTHVSSGALQKLGYSQEEVHGLILMDVATALNQEEFERHARALRSGTSPRRTFITQHRRKDGTHYTVEYRLELFRDETPPVFVVNARDISLRVRAQEALLTQMEQTEVTLNCINDAVITTDAQGRIDHLNPAAELLTGWDLGEAHGKHAHEVFQLVDEVMGQPLPCLVERCLKEDGRVMLANHVALKRRDGSLVAVEDSVAPIRNAQCQIIGTVRVFHDISHERALRNQISYQATHDALTGLPNRREFEHRLARAMDDICRVHREHVLFYMDVDQFKLVNDTCGHNAGDELLRQLAQALLSQIRGSDTLARLGGDEFGVLLENCRLDKAMCIVEQIRERVRAFNFSWDGKTFDIGLSVGVVPLTSTSADHISSVLGAADLACYAAKEKGRNHVHVYREDDVDLMRRHSEMHWVADLRQAMAEGRLRLYFQDIKPLRRSSGERHYHEVLLRLRDRDGHLILPGAFIPAAERYDLMPTLDRWVIRHALQAWGGNRREGHGLSINLSGKSLNGEDLKSFILSQFEEHRVDPGEICFEITETAAVDNLTTTANFVKELKTHGCRFALDDFGSGFSSFAYLQQLPVDYLKIDGIFVKDMLENPMHRALVESINHIGHVLNIRTIAEYVENTKILKTIKDIGVDFAQGYGIGHPSPMSTPLAGNETLPEETTPKRIRA